MEKKYILVDSTYRDRFLYPNPAEFILPVNTAIGNNVFNSKNPLLEGYPVHNFWFNSSTGSFSGTIVGGNPSALQVEDTIDTLTGVGSSDVSTSIDEAMDMFLNVTLTVEGDSNTYTVTGYDSVRHILSVNTPVLGFTIGGVYTISNTSTSDSIVLQGYAISTTGYVALNDGYFLSSTTPIYVWDLTLNEVRKGTLVNTTVSLNSSFSDAWSVSDQYAIAISENVEIGTIVPFSSGDYLRMNAISKVNLTEVGSVYQSQTEVSVLRLGEAERETSTIARVGVLFTTATGGISKWELKYGGANYQFGVSYVLVPEGYTTTSPGLATVIITAMGTAFLTTTNTDKTQLVGSYFMSLLLTPQFSLSSSAPYILQTSPMNSLPYVPSHILTNLSPLEANSFNGVSPILDTFMYQGKQVILVQSLSPALYTRWQAINLSSFPEALNFEILRFQRDGCVPMDYRGTMVSSNQMVCYALSVNALILPNQILNLPFGALTSSYPYVLLEITNETASSGHNKSIIYSNNPNTVSATFVCSVSDVNSPAITKFINIDSDGASQVLKFKPNDNLRFRISMPDGRTFETEIVDYLPPLNPNPLLQINCLIEIRRLE